MKNARLSYHDANENRLGLARAGVTARSPTVLLTPRFRASRHVVTVVLSQESHEPVVFAKLPRLAEDNEGLAHEAKTLHAVHEGRPGGFETIPRVLALERLGNRSLLIQSALVGDPIVAEVVQRERSRCVDAVTEWLFELTQAHRASTAEEGDWFDRLITEPLASLRNVVPEGGEERALVDDTLRLLHPLSEVELPLVFEHGDLGPPNLIWLRSGEVGVVDWELAEQRGLPVYDLYFFLTYAAISVTRAKTVREAVRAFHEAFIVGGGGSVRRVVEYADRFGVPTGLLPALLVACWARYTARALQKLRASPLGSRPCRKGLDADAVTWLCESRYYALWRHAFFHARDMRWPDA